MKFEILELKRKRLGSLHLHPQRVLVRFEGGPTKWFDTYDIDSGLFFYKLFKDIEKDARIPQSRKPLFTTTFEITDQYSYQKYEGLLKKRGEG